MEIGEAEKAVKNHTLVGTSNAGNCLFVVGYLIRKIKIKGKPQFTFKERRGEIAVTRPASKFILAE